MSNVLSEESARLWTRSTMRDAKRHRRADDDTGFASGMNGAVNNRAPTHRGSGVRAGARAKSFAFRDGRCGTSPTEPAVPARKTCQPLACAWQPGRPGGPSNKSTVRDVRMTVRIESQATDADRDHRLTASFIRGGRGSD
jgi:hypothetical protein